MRNFLIPITATVWYFITYFSLFGILVCLPIVFSLGWFWLIVAFSFIIGLVSLIYSFASIASIGILYLYRLNWVSCIVHSIFGLLAMVSFVYFYSTHPVMAADENLLSYMWSKSALKTIIVVPSFVMLFISVVYVMVLNPIFVKVEGKY